MDGAVDGVVGVLLLPHAVSVSVNVSVHVRLPLPQLLLNRKSVERLSDEMPTSENLAQIDGQP